MHAPLGSVLLTLEFAVPLIQALSWNCCCCLCVSVCLCAYVIPPHPLFSNLAGNEVPIGKLCKCSYREYKMQQNWDLKKSNTDKKKIKGGVFFVFLADALGSEPVLKNDRKIASALFNVWKGVACIVFLFFYFFVCLIVTVLHMVYNCPYVVHFENSKELW